MSEIKEISAMVAIQFYSMLLQNIQAAGGTDTDLQWYLDPKHQSDLQQLTTHIINKK